MLLQEMIDQVSDEIRNVSIQAKIIRWLNMSLTDLASNYVFGNLHRHSSRDTLIGAVDIVLGEIIEGENDFHWLKTIEIPADNRKLYPRSEQILSEIYPDYRVRQGTITHYYLNGNIAGLFYVPAEVKTITYSYQRRPVKLVEPQKGCDLPVEWHPLVIQKAVTMGFRYEGNTEGREASERAEVRLLRGLASNVYKRPDETLVAGGEASVSTKPGRVKLGSNPLYPGVRW